MAEPRTENYTVTTDTAVYHNGTRYDTGATIKLTAEEAEKLTLYVTKA